MYSLTNIFICMSAEKSVYQKTTYIETLSYEFSVQKRFKGLHSKKSLSVLEHEYLLKSSVV